MFYSAFAFLQEKPSRAFSIRMIESEKYKVIEKFSNEILEEIEDSRAFFQVRSLNNNISWFFLL